MKELQRLLRYLWPKSLFGRLLMASVVAVLLAQAVALFLIAQEREHFVLQGSVREWTRRIAETTLMLEPLTPAERADAVSELATPAPDGAARPLHTQAGHRAPQPGFVRVPLLPGFENTLREHLRAALGPKFKIEVDLTPDPAPTAVPVPVPFYEAHELAQHQDEALHYDVTIRFPDGDSVIFRVTRIAGGAPLPRNLVINLILLLMILVVVLYGVARGITLPLSDIARAADSVGRDLRPAQLRERGARELRDAARAFNTMQDRLRRYLDSRTRVLAAMSHDLKTPLTRLRLQVETLDDPTLQERIGHELDEMETMVHQALSLFRGLDDGEAVTPIDVNALLEKVRAECAVLGGDVSISGRALSPFPGKAQTLKRCLTNLIVNAIKFGGRAQVLVEDGAQLTIRVCDEGPGIPEAELERVFEPFYRLESSRNRDSGGTGLGLTIARDIAQAHSGSLTLRNRDCGGLEAVLVLPRR